MRTSNPSPDPVIPAARSVSWTWVCLGAVLLLALVMRVSFGSVGLDPWRFWDERHSVRNVEAVLFNSGLEPQNGFYLGLNHLPPAALIYASQGLYQSLDIEWFSVYEERARWINRKALLLCRLLQAVYGTLSIWMIFLIGRRLYSAETGLLAALLLCAVPMHIKLSGIFKPDIMTVLMTLVAFYLTIKAIDRPSFWRYLHVGVAIGLATGAKYTGIPSALPLASVTLADHLFDLRRWRWLAAAALASVGTFILFNPYLKTVLWYIPIIKAVNARRALQTGTTRWDVPQFVLEKLFTPYWFGPVIGSIAFLGSLALIVTLLSRRSDSQERLAAGLVISYIVGFLVFYTASSPEPKANLLVTLLPFFALAAASLLTRIWKALPDRSSSIQWLPVGPLVWAAVAVWVLAPAVVFSLSPAIPKTWNLAGATARETLNKLEVDRRAQEGWGQPDARAFKRIIIEAPGTLKFRERLLPRLLVIEAKLDSESPGFLDSMDAEIFPASRLSGPAKYFYEQRVESVEEQGRALIRERWWGVGPSLIVLTHPWIRIRTSSITTQQTPLPEAPELVFEVRPPSQASHLTSLEVWLPRSSSSMPVLTISNRPIPMYWTNSGHNALVRYLSARFPAPRGGLARVTYSPLASFDDSIKTVVHYWSPPVPRRNY